MNGGIGSVSVDFLSLILVAVGALIVLGVFAIASRLSRRPPRNGRDAA